MAMQLVQYIPCTLEHVVVFFALWLGTSLVFASFHAHYVLYVLYNHLNPLVISFVVLIGDHFDPVGQLMFGKETIVEAAVVEFTSQEAADRTKWDRQDLDLPLPRSRL